MEHGRRYRNVPPKMGRLVIGLEFVWTYPVKLLELGMFMTRNGELIADLVMCTPRLAVSGPRMEIYFLRVVQIMTTLGVMLPFWGLLLSFAPLPIGHKKMVALHTLLIFLFPVKNTFIWMYNFSYYMLIITMLTHSKRMYDHRDGEGGILSDTSRFLFLLFLYFLISPPDVF